MKGTFTKKALGRTALLSGATLVFGFSGSAFAAYIQQHESIVLKDPAGTPITEMNAPGNAFSMKTTCFTTDCHGDTNAPGNLKYTYDDIEKHSYHAQIGANEQKGYNPWNPDATVTEFDKDGLATGNQTADKWRRGAGPVGKNWVQSPGHVGSW